MVTVSVPKEWYGEFHEFFGKWLASKASPVENEPEAMRTSQTWLNWKQGDDIGRFNDARRFYQLITPKARRLLDYWIDHPGVINSSQELADATGIEDRTSIPGVLASMGARRKPMKRSVPFEFRDGPNGGTFWMEPEVSSLFLSARDSLS